MVRVERLDISTQTVQTAQSRRLEVPRNQPLGEQTRRSECARRCLALTCGLVDPGFNLQQTAIARTRPPPFHDISRAAAWHPPVVLSMIGHHDRSPNIHRQMETDRRRGTRQLAAVNSSREKRKFHRLRLCRFEKAALSHHRNSVGD